MKNVFRLLAIIAFIVAIEFSMAACGSSPGNSSNNSEPVVTVLEEVTIDLDSDDGKKLLSQAVKTYTSKYSYYNMDIRINDIQYLVDGNYPGYRNRFEIYRVVKKDFTFYSIVAQHNVMIVAVLFSDKPFEGGVSRMYSWEYNRRYSNGEREKEQAARNNEAEWNRFFESKYNEALLKLSIEKRKVPSGEDNIKLKVNISDDEGNLLYYKTLKTLWFSAEN